MFAIGILSLLGMGVAMSMSGGDSGDDTQETTNDTSDETSLADFDTDQENVFVDLSGDEDSDGEDEGPLNGFGESDEDDLDGSFEDDLDDLNALLNALDDEDDDFEDGDSGAAETSVRAEPEDALDNLTLPQFGDLFAESVPPQEEVEEPTSGPVAPPVGEDFRDPIIVAEELEAQRLLDEAAAEEQRILDEIAFQESRQPENLVTVVAANGDEVADDVVLSESPDDGEESFEVVAPEGSHDIEVRYDAERTFDITYTGETGSITAGLNSDITGPEGNQARSVIEEVDENGNEVRTRVFEMQFDTSTDITLEVAQEHIGQNMAQIDLTNPNDTLHFEFDEDVVGNMHLVYTEIEEEGEDGDTITTMRAFVIGTDEGISSLTENDLANILAAGDEGFDGAAIMAEIYLGEDQVTVYGDPNGDEPYEQRIIDYMNESPTITSSLQWSSTTTLDEEPVSTGTGGGMGSEGSGGFDDRGLDEILEDAGINPDFFGGFGLDL